MTAAAEAAEATVVGTVFHPFSPQGISGVVVIEESHLSIHTWPEHGYAAVDFFTCGECLPERAHEVIKEGLSAATSEAMMVIRGMLPGPHSMQIQNTEREPATEPISRIASRPRSESTEPIACSARR